MGLTDVEVKNGPGTFLLPILHKSSYVQTATTLDPIEYQVVTNSLDGKKRVEVGPQLLFLRAYDELDGEKKTAISLKATEFVRLLDCQTGQVRVEAGEQGKIIPGPYEKFVDKEGVRSAIALKCHEYVRIEDKQTGSTRVERGEQLVFLTGHEEIVGKVSKAVEIDEETAVLVRNKREGHQRLVTEQQVFVPRSDEEVIEVRKLIKLADHEACIVRGKDGTDRFLFGKNPDERAFFLPPYSEVVELAWSRGRRRERRDLILKKIDLRPKFIERVSKATLQEFMRDFNKIAETVHKEDDDFYRSRGVLIHSLEVSGYRCAESSTAQILQQIIQETTNRMN